MSTPSDRETTPTGNILIYGATGYTGTLIAEHATRAGLQITIGGRNPARVAALAEQLDSPAVVFDAADADQAVRALEPFDVLLNVAGPFRHTAEPLMRASLDSGTHYLDTTAEFETFTTAASFDDAARRAGVMIMSGVGWDVVPTDSLAVYVAQRAVEPISLRIAIRIAGGFSRGSLESAAGIENSRTLVRRSGLLVPAPPETTRTFDSGDGAEEYTLASMGDLVTGHHSTGLGDIEVYLRTDSGFPDRDEFVSGPTAHERSQDRYHALAEVTEHRGKTVRARIDTPNGYTFTQLSSVEVARRAAAGEVRPGFQSPASVYGHQLATSIYSTTITDL
ncbi:saccharopine dehydrogenase family protein [Brachybacterium sp. GCM10030268]|uniref:saccharopine dehydrogenase family protein n=1 Tax=Brachybacterium sp. GCM10030268 TaxID=3273382 RepID=UPI003611E823